MKKSVLALAMALALPVAAQKEASVTLKVNDAKEKIKVGKNMELYPLKDLIRTGDDGNPESDCDKISDVANSWLFLD